MRPALCSAIEGSGNRASVLLAYIGTKIHFQRLLPTRRTLDGVCRIATDARSVDVFLRFNNKQGKDNGTDAACANSSNGGALTMTPEMRMPISLDDIEIGEGRRSVNEAVVKRLAESIERIGLREPITVLERKDGKYRLVAGRHRVEAHKRLGLPGIMAVITTMTKTKARLWEISENLHRAELTKVGDGLARDCRSGGEQRDCPVEK
jgi:uncharacterized ParB-like nuclease family protein